MSDDRLDVLFVCTANVCRSPAAVALLGAGLEPRLGSTSWRVGSAGTHALEGAPIHPTVGAMLEERGVDPPVTTARQLTAELVERSALILTAEREHRAAVVSLVPGATRRTFTLRHFGRMCVAGSASTTSPVTDVAGLMGVANVGRSTLQPLTEADDAIGDPTQLDTIGFRACVDLIAASVDEMLRPVVTW